MCSTAERTDERFALARVTCLGNDRCCVPLRPRPRLAGPVLFVERLAVSALNEVLLSSRFLYFALTVFLLPTSSASFETLARRSEDPTLSRAHQHARTPRW